VADQTQADGHENSKVQTEVATLTVEGGIRRREVLDRAAELFAQRGFDATSINDIATATTIKKASLYHYFPSKQSILTAILEDGIAELLADAEKAAQIRDPAERIRGLLAAHLKSFRHKLPQVIVFLHERNALDPELTAGYLQQRQRYDSLYVDAIREGQQRRMFRDEDPAVLAYAVLGMMNWMVQWYNPNGRLSLDEIAEILEQCALGAISRPS
jgi:AcrR family transcriptional regulator